ncbi:MAG: hypothetical protein CVU28_09955, partial [Betaproteobacteria bacterium HGW-Betaproteobacteria-21]
VAQIDAVAIEIDDLTSLPGQSARYRLSLRSAAGEMLESGGDLTLRPVAAKGALALKGVKAATLARGLARLVTIEPPAGDIDFSSNYALALGQDPLDRFRGLAVLAVAPDIGHMEKGGTLETDLDEGRLHTGQHAHDLAQIHVADDAATGGPFDVQLLHDTLFNDRDPRLLRGEIDQELDTHGGFSPMGNAQ